MTNRNQYTNIDKYILHTLLKAGCGWSEYANNIIKQGDITERQRTTIKRMFAKLRSQQCAAEYRKSRKYTAGKMDGDDISDSEAMFGGEYF